MATIGYVKGDATQPQSKGNRIIAHVCNDFGGRGKGFVVACHSSRPPRYHRQSPLAVRTVTTGIPQRCRPPRPPTGR
jgi:O-acetyl-ADP-ribose deacetylase (regulator of RNase III)